MTVVVHVSDLHFGRHLPDITEALVEALKAVQPDLVVVSGDLTQRATAVQFKAGREFVKRLPTPCMVIPGNHDLSAYNLPERFLFPWRKWRRYIDTELEPVVHGRGVTAVGLNTVRRMGWYLDWSRGRINRTQFKGIWKKFQGAPADDLRLVVAHHPFRLPERYSYRRLTSRAEAALQMFKGAGVDIILGGHVHSAFVRLTHGMIVSHAGTAISSRHVDGQANMFTVIRGDRASLHLQQMQWDGTGFVPVSERSFCRKTDGWNA